MTCMKTVHGWMKGFFCVGILLCLGCGAKDFMPIHETYRSISWVETQRQPGLPLLVYKGFWRGDQRRLEGWVRESDTAPERLHFVSIYSGDSFAVVVRGRLHTQAKRGEYDIQDYPRERMLNVAKEILSRGEEAGREPIEGDECRRFSLVTEAKEKSAEAQVWIDGQSRIRQILLTGLTDQNRFEQRIYQIRYDPELDPRLFAMPTPRAEPAPPAPSS